MLSGFFGVLKNTENEIFILANVYNMWYNENNVQ